MQDGTIELTQKITEDMLTEEQSFNAGSCHRP